MGSFTRWFVAAVLSATCTLGTVATAQTTTGTISGHVADTQGLALPGVTINASSANLQGIRTVTTSGNGDYIFTLLPPGTYVLSFELSGFEKQQKTVAVAPTQTVPFNLTMGPAAVAETVTVVGRAADVLTRTAQVATNFQQDLINLLPTNRSIDSTLLLAPSVHPTGPAGAYSIGGSMSFESLFLVNGVTVNENLRGQAQPLIIEDAIQETTVATSGVSAEFGRFGGGVVNVVTKSGGNIFSGSLRDTLYNDHWRTLTPFEQTSIAADPNHADTRISRTVPTYEYTFGGPIAKDRLWFFTAGRLQNQSQGRQTVAPLNIPYTFEQQTKRFEGKVTYSVNSNNTFQGAYTKIIDNRINDTFNTATSMDARSLYNRQLPQSLFTINYNGVLSPTFFVEGRFSSRQLDFVGTGATSTDIIQGTLVLDRTRGNLRYWAATFCGVCDPESRNNDDTFLKGSYFLSTKGGGSHNMAFGYDTYDDKRFANNHQSGSDYRILGTTSIIQGTNIFPQFLPASTILQYNPIAVGSSGTHFRTHSLFYNDNWRLSNVLTLNLGVRWDKNRGEDSANQLVAKDSGWSPRLGLVWDPKGNGRWAVTASVAKYIAGINNGLADSSSAAGNPATLQWTYTGPAINPIATGPLVTTDVAIQQVFNWFNAAGGTKLTPSSSSVPGVSVRIPNSLNSPNVREFAGGISNQLTDRSTVRMDVVYRSYHDFYSQRIDQSTGTVVDQFGNKSDLAIVENTDALKRRYAGMTLSANYRVGMHTAVGGNYTLSRLWGNFDGENSNSGPLFADLFQYPEYRSASWYLPDGDLSSDQRHRASIWFNYSVPRMEGLSLSLLQEMASGLPYGALGLVDARPFVTAPAYATPQGATTENYYYTARDAFHTAAMFRTDLAVNYSHAVTGGARKVEVFGQMQVLNILNRFQLCGCGADVFTNGGAVFLTRIGSSVLNPTNTASLAKFNPLTTTPVLGTNWNYGANFGTALNRLAYTSPRTLRLSFGVRF